MRKPILVLFLGGLVLALAIAPGTAQRPPLKIGLLAPITGPQAANGKEMAIHTFPKVSQFWTYDPAEFLKAPVYSRDYPPCRSC
jgi:hypothetical protein